MTAFANEHYWHSVVHFAGGVAALAGEDGEGIRPLPVLFVEARMPAACTMSPSSWWTKCGCLTFLSASSSSTHSQ